MDACLSERINDNSCSNLLVNSCLFGLLIVIRFIFVLVGNCDCGACCAIWADMMCWGCWACCICCWWPICCRCCWSGTAVVAFIGARVTIRELSFRMIVDVVASALAFTTLFCVFVVVVFVVGVAVAGCCWVELARLVVCRGCC